jgi:hypothetical protein
MFGELIAIDKVLAAGFGELVKNSALACAP